MRYFCFFFIAYTEPSQASHIQGQNKDNGLITVESAVFPSNEIIKQTVQRTRYNTGWKVLLTNMYEFKNKEDYDNFNKQQVIVND